MPDPTLDGRQRILGVHRSTVGKMIARGELESRGFTGAGRGCLRRDQVVALAKARRRAAADRVAAMLRAAQVEPPEPPGRRP